MPEQLSLDVSLDEVERGLVRAWAEEWNDAAIKAAEFGAKLSSIEATIAPLVLRLLNQVEK